jgi:hypothetical protein
LLNSFQLPAGKGQGEGQQETSERLLPLPPALCQWEGVKSAP